VKLDKKPQIESFLAAPPPEVRAAVIHGDDRGGVRERADRLARVSTENPEDPFNVDLLTEREIDQAPARLEEALSALSLMGGRRLVRVRLTEPKPAVERAVAEALKAHLEGRLNPDAFLLIETDALPASSVIRGAAEKSPAAACIPLYQEDLQGLAGLVLQSLTREGLSISPEALSALAARLPRERGVVRSEIERLVLYLGPGSAARAELADLEAFFGVEPEASLRDAAGDAFGGRAGPCQSALRRARAEGEDGSAALRALTGHLARLRRGRLLLETGASAKEVAGELRLFWKEEAEMLRQIRAWPGPEIAQVGQELLDADAACKQTGAADHLISERLALSIAFRARRFGLGA
jgi:DNA polymerase-3 subunit delta